MKKTISLICMLVLFLVLLSGCTRAGEVQAQELYKQLLSGELSATDKNGVAKPLADYVSSGSLDEGYAYCFYDMNDDGISEICIKKYPEMHFFTVKDGAVCHWYTETKAYSKLLDNGAFLYERHGAAPTHINYEYYELDENASEKFSFSFSWWDGTTVEEGKTYSDFYEIDGKEVSEEEYRRKTEKYLTIGDDDIVWYDKNGVKEADNRAIRSELLDVMNGEAMLINEVGEEVYLPAYHIPDAPKMPIMPIGHTFVDLNGDGYEELVIRLMSDAGFDMILHKQDGKTYRHSLGARSFQGVKITGAFTQSSSAAITSITKLTFNKTEMTVETLAERNDIDKIYRIGGKEVSKQEAENYFDEHYAVKSCDWMDVTATESLLAQMDAAFEEALDKTESTGEMVDVCAAYENMWRQAANIYYSRIMAHICSDETITAALHDHTEALKANWENYYKSECDEYGEILNTLYGGGTLIQGVYAHHTYKLQRDWALELLGICRQLG